MSMEVCVKILHVCGCLCVTVLNVCAKLCETTQCVGKIDHETPNGLGDWGHCVCNYAHVWRQMLTLWRGSTACACELPTQITRQPATVTQKRFTVHYNNQTLAYKQNTMELSGTWSGTRTTLIKCQVSMCGSERGKQWNCWMTTHAHRLDPEICHAHSFTDMGSNSKQPKLLFFCDPIIPCGSLASAAMAFLEHLISRIRLDVTL